MKHKFSLDGYCYRLRPVKITDADFIIDVRLEDAERNQFIHTISRDIELQKKWIKKYFETPDDYYFVIENRITGRSEGLISFYNVEDGKAEWGRWVIKKGSLAAVESVYLIYRIAFEQIGLKELYCCTIADNLSVVSFHESIGEITRAIHKASMEFNGRMVDVVEQYSDKEHFYNEIAPKLEKHAAMIMKREMKHEFGGMDFHHIGIACECIEKEIGTYFLLGYSREGDMFEDEEQGIRGQFMVAKNQPRIELLENLPQSSTLNKFIESGNKIYHMAYYVKDIDKAVETLSRNKSILISPLKKSTYFKKRICFFVLRNMQMIELLEC